MQAHDTVLCEQECGEEAGIPPELAATAIAAGAVSYAALQPAGVKRDVLFVYDLRLPPDFVPTPQALPSTVQLLDNQEVMAQQCARLLIRAMSSRSCVLGSRCASQVLLGCVL